MIRFTSADRRRIKKAARRVRRVRWKYEVCELCRVYGGRYFPQLAALRIIAMIILWGVVGAFLLSAAYGVILL